MFPYCREVSIRVGQVEKVGEVVDAQRTKMLELVNGESILTDTGLRRTNWLRP